MAMEFTRRRMLQLTGSALTAGAVAWQLPGLAHAQSGRPDLTWRDTFDRSDGPVGRGWTALRGEWQIAGGGLESPSGPPERVIVQSEFELGISFAIEATVRNQVDNNWDGLAFNVIDHGDGTQSYYALRFVTRGDTRPPSWQLLQVTSSVVDNTSLIASGQVPVTRGVDYTVQVSSASFGVVDIAILDGSTELMAQRSVVPLARLLSGGHVGVYTGGGGTVSGGGVHVDRIQVVTSVPGARAPDPGPLVFVPFVGEPYELPQADEQIVGRVLVDTALADHPVGQSVLTHGDQQYVAYYNVERQMIVAQRSLSSDVWLRQPLDSVTGWDSHNYITMAVDRTGHLHVSGNMHGVPLIYFRSEQPGDVTSLVRVPNMVDAATEQRVTYPRFFRDAEDALVFRFRDGGSGDGADIYNIYDEAAGRWTRLLDQPLHDGEGLRNAYVEGPVLGPDGFYHVVWVWRDTGDAATNQHLSYARSPDLRTWERSDGSPLTLPITFATGEIIDPIPMNGGIINGSHKVGFDARGRVSIAYHKYDEDGNTQIYIARREPAGWKIRQISRWEGRWTIGGFGTLIFEVNIQAVTPLHDGNVRLDFTCKGNRRTWVLSPGLQVIAEVDTPQLPDEITTMRSTFPDMRINTEFDLGTASEGRYLLRWESRVSNRDRPWPPPHPENGPLEIYHLA